MREIFERNSEKLTVEEDGRVWEVVEGATHRRERRSVNWLVPVSVLVGSAAVVFVLVRDQSGTLGGRLKDTKRSVELRTFAEGYIPMSVPPHVSQPVMAPPPPASGETVSPKDKQVEELPY